MAGRSSWSPCVTRSDVTTVMGRWSFSCTWTSLAEEMVTQVRQSEYWPGMLELAPTLAYDAACLGDGRPPVDRLITISQSTLVLTGPGGEAASQEMAVDFMGNSADAIVARYLRP